MLFLYFICIILVTYLQLYLVYIPVISSNFFTPDQTLCLQFFFSKKKKIQLHISNGISVVCPQNRKEDGHNLKNL